MALKMDTHPFQCAQGSSFCRRLVRWLRKPRSIWFSHETVCTYGRTPTDAASWQDGAGLASPVRRQSGQFAPSRNFTRCRSAVLEVARFQSESFDCCLRKPAPRFDLLIRSHHCTDNCFGLLRILFGHEVDRADGRTAP